MAPHIPETAMPNPIRLYTEAAIGIATMIAVGFVAGLAAGALSGDRSVVIGACAIAFALSGIELAVRLWRIARRPTAPIAAECADP
jgi:hypothetical protein